MGEQRNTLIDMTRVAAAAGIILCHVDLADCGAVGTFLGQFLCARFSLMFFLAVIGYYVEKACRAGKKPIFRRVCTLLRMYGAWSLVYLALSFVLLVVIQGMPLSQYLTGRVKGFLFTGSYYHFWFYPAAIYALLLIGGAKRLLGQRSLSVLLPLAAVAYAVGLLGTGYLPLGQQIPGLRVLYGAENFEPVMHLAFLGFPAVVFGMAAAQKEKEPSGIVLLICAAAYVAEAVVLCLVLGWNEDPQMLASTPLLTVVFLRWAQNRRFAACRVDPLLFRSVSAGMYNVHPLVLAAFAAVVPEWRGLPAFALCAVCSAVFGWMLYRLRKMRFFMIFA